MGITSMLVLFAQQQVVQGGKMHTNIHKYMYMRYAPTVKKQTPAFFVFQQRCKHAEKHKAISHSDPYHYLPCKAHLTDRPAAQTSAIFTYFLSRVRSPQLHLACKGEIE